MELKCTVVNPLSEDQAFTLTKEDNANLWEQMKDDKVGRTRRVLGARLLFSPIEDGVRGYELSEAHTHLTEAFRNVPHISVTRDHFVLVLSGAPEDHPGFAPLLVSKTGDTAASVSSEMGTSVTDTPRKKSVSERQQEDRERQNANSTSATSAANALKRKYTMR